MHTVTSLIQIRELRVVAAVMGILLLCEVGMRLVETRLSKDTAHLREFPSIAQELVTNESTGPRVLFLGNSLTRHGVDLPTFESAIESIGVNDAFVTAAHPDNTALADWYYLFKSHFADSQSAPDLVIIGFEGGHLRDAPSRHPGRLARYYTGWQGAGEVLQRDYNHFGDRVDYLLSTVSSLYANRDRVNRRTLYTLIPGYPETAQKINEAIVAKNQHVVEPTGNEESSYTCNRLRDFVAHARSSGTHVVLVAMPVPYEYGFDPELLKAVDKLEIQLVDCREVEGITDDLFPDGLHMNEIAAKIYTEELARRLSDLVASIKRPDVVAAN